MDALDEHVARRSEKTARILTVVGPLIAIAVEIDVISRMWINPVQGHNEFHSYLIPVLTALPLFLCLSMQVGVRKALKSGDMSSKIANNIEIVLGVLILATYQAIQELMRFVQ